MPHGNKTWTKRCACDSSDENGFRKHVIDSSGIIFSCIWPGTTHHEWESPWIPLRIIDVRISKFWKGSSFQLIVQWSTNKYIFAMESSSSKSAKTMFLVIYIPLALFIILSAILLVILHVCGISLDTSVTICEMKISMKWFYLLWFAFAVFIISAISALQYAKILCKRFKKRYVQIVDICLIF